MEEKNVKTGKTKMNKQEFLLNKPLLKEINEKKRTTSYGQMGGISPSKMDVQSRISAAGHEWKAKESCSFDREWNKTMMIIW